MRESIERLVGADEGQEGRGGGRAAGRMEGGGGREADERGGETVTGPERVNTWRRRAAIGRVSGGAREGETLRRPISSVSKSGDADPARRRCRSTLPGTDTDY